MRASTYNGPERRREPRIPVMPEFIYMFVFPSDERLENNGVILDFSIHGAGITYCNRLEDGNKIKVFTELLGDCHKDVNVKWCNKIANDVYRIGLSFW